MYWSITAGSDDQAGRLLKVALGLGDPPVVTPAVCNLDSELMAMWGDEL